MSLFGLQAVTGTPVVSSSTTKATSTSAAGYKGMWILSARISIVRVKLKLPHMPSFEKHNMKLSVISVAPPYLLGILRLTYEIWKDYGNYGKYSGYGAYKREPEAAEASPTSTPASGDYGTYGKYGKYGKYGSYGSYKRDVEDME